MKKSVLYLGALALTTLSVWSCNQQTPVVEPEEASSVSATATARLAGDTTGFHRRKKLTRIAVTELPAAISRHISANYGGATVAYAAKDDSGNFLVALTQGADRRTLLFNSDGTFNREVARPERRGGSRPGRDSLQTVAEAELPANVRSYLAANYAGATVNLAAKDASRGFFVMITINNERKTLVFNTDGTFREEVTRRPREKFQRIEVSALPKAVTDYVAANYAGSTIQVAGRNTSGQFMVWVKPATGAPVALMFAADGTFVQVLAHRR